MPSVRANSAPMAAVASVKVPLESGAHPDARTRVSFDGTLVHLGSQAAVIMSVPSFGPLNVTD
jgi:hypothetical protein